MRSCLLILVLASTASAQALPGPAPELGPADAKLDLPAVPSFELPGAPAGQHTVTELRVQGQPLLGTEVKVAGYITWIYSCASLDVDPTKCERPKFYLGATKGAPADAALWVVDVPRAPNKLERERLPKADLAKWPVPPKLAVGDYVTVIGTFTQTSPHKETNSDGLLVFKALDHTPPPAASTTTIPALAPPQIALPTIAKPAKATVTASARSESVQHANAANKAYAAKQLDVAGTEYQAAVTAWPGNHVAWYGLAGLALARGDAAAARDALAHAVEAAPDQPMYWMLYGNALYDTDRAGKLDPPVSALLQAIKLEPRLWRAHYYLGRIYRDRGYAKAAADELTRACASAPPIAAPYVALAQLYRTWGYTQQAVAVATQGTTRATGSDATDLWLVGGMATSELGNDAKAIELLTKSLELKPNNAKALFQRGRAYAHLKDAVHARADLEAFLKIANDDLGFARIEASQLLLALPKH